MILREMVRQVESGWIGVLSDTHIPRRAYSLPPTLFKVLDGASLIIHAGDLVEERVMIELEALAPVAAVAGNMDPPELQTKLGSKKIITFQEKRLGLVHGAGRGELTKEWSYQEFMDSEVDGIIFGHLHQPVCEYRDSVLLFNPGSPTNPRGNSRPSCGKVWLERNTLRAEVISLD